MQVNGLNNSWALVTFSSGASAVDALCPDDESLARRAASQSVEKTGIAKLAGLPPDEEPVYTMETKLFGGERVLYKRLTKEAVEQVAALSDIVNGAEFELLSREQTGVGFEIATRLQNTVNLSLGSFGRLVPIQTFYVLRFNAELWSAVLDIGFSAIGFWFSPLFFSYHLIQLHRLQGAEIVVKAITTNWSRLFTTMLLATLVMYVFAVIALLNFQQEHLENESNSISVEHVAANGSVIQVEKEAGPCQNLLQCFTFYMYAGLLQEGLREHLIDPAFPRTIESVISDSASGLGLARVVWEVCFMVRIVLGSV